MFLTTILILITAIGLGALTIVLVNKQPELRKIFQAVYALFIIVLAVVLVARIMQPINFKKERLLRENTAIEKLKQIRTVQEAYKDKFGKYTGSFDTLFSFVNTDSFEISSLVIVGDWNQDEMTKEQALRQGIIKKSVLYVQVRDSLFATDDVVEDLKYIPFTDNTEEFVMGAGEVETGSQVKVKVFEAYALYDVLFNGMDRQEVINYKDDRYKIIEFEGVKVGSLTEANNNAGNWEK